MTSEPSKVPTPLRGDALEYGVRRFFVAVVFVAAEIALGTPRADAGPRFTDGVANILRRRCVRCHSGPDAHNGLRLDSYDALMRGAQDGPVVIPGDPNGSLLMQKVLRRDDPPMPPRKKLRRKDVRIIRKWIEAGALS